MFGAFHGMGKYLDGPLKHWVSQKIKGNPALEKVVFPGSRGLVLTIGDMAVMQGLYAAENGGLGWSWEAAFVALVFRGGPQVAEFFPKLTARWRGLPKEKQNEIINRVVPEERPSAEIAKERLEWLQENDARIAQKNTTQAR